MAKFGFKVDTVPTTLEEVQRLFDGYKVSTAGQESMVRRIANVATQAMRDLNEVYKKAVRSNIRKGGFGSKWSNAWRVNTYPKTGSSLTPAIYGYHKIPYARIFEEGGTITGKSGLLWIPFPAVPRIGRNRATPKALIARGVKLFSINRAGKAPLLATKVAGTGPFGGKKALTISKLKSGSKKKKATGPQSTLVLFHGHSSVQIKKRFNIQGITRITADRVTEYYAKAAQNEARNNG